jgi:hypothetical protein
MLYGTFFSSKVKSALCENGPEIKTKPNTMKNEDEVVTERERERERVVQSPRTFGAPTAALTAISRDICDGR